MCLWGPVKQTPGLATRRQCLTTEDKKLDAARLVWSRSKLLYDRTLRNSTPLSVVALNYFTEVFVVTLAKQVRCPYFRQLDASEKIITRTFNAEGFLARRPSVQVLVSCEIKNMKPLLLHEASMLSLTWGNKKINQIWYTVCGSSGQSLSEHVPKIMITPGVPTLVARELLCSVDSFKASKCT